MTFRLRSTVNVLPVDPFKHSESSVTSSIGLAIDIFVVKFVDDDDSPLQEGDRMKLQCLTFSVTVCFVEENDVYRPHL